MKNDKLHAAADSEMSQDKVKKVLEKYDLESNVRKWNNKSIVWFFSILAISYAIFHLYITFNLLPTLLQRNFHLMFGLGMVFLLYPTFKAQDRRKIPFYDWMLLD